MALTLSVPVVTDFHDETTMRNKQFEKKKNIMPWGAKEFGNSSNESNEYKIIKLVLIPWLEIYWLQWSERRKKENKA